MPKHISVKTLDAPEFINLTPLDINPGLGKCEIKVLYLEGNRNHSWISKDVATNMAKTLRGAPIVGYFKEEKDDFIDHGEQVIIDDEGIKFKKVTRPYGFVAPDAEVWFQNFEDEDEFGNKIIRTYLMTTGYMWLQQYPEGQAVIDEGRPHSMELDKNRMQGNWSTNLNNGIEYFIISDAVFQALCILGEDVEPCFEGSSITKPDVSASFTKVDDNFTKTLYTMMQELTFALRGGQQMNENNVLNTNTVEPQATPDVPTDHSVVTPEPVADTQASAVQGTEGSEGSFACGNKDDEDKDKEKKANSSKNEDDKDKEKDEPEKDEKDDDEKEKGKKNYELIESQYEELKAQFSALQEENKVLVDFKNKIEAKEKTELINSFYMLSDEDKKEVVDNMSTYSLEQIESKLAVKCLKKGIFSQAQEAEQTDKAAPATTFNLDTANASGNENNNAPEWVAACIKTRDNRK